MNVDLDSFIATFINNLKDFKSFKILFSESIVCKTKNLMIAYIIIGYT